MDRIFVWQYYSDWIWFVGLSFMLAGRWWLEKKLKKRRVQGKVLGFVDLVLVIMLRIIVYMCCLKMALLWILCLGHVESVVGWSYSVNSRQKLKAVGMFPTASPCFSVVFKNKRKHIDSYKYRIYDKQW